MGKPCGLASSSKRPPLGPILRAQKGRGPITGLLSKQAHVSTDNIRGHLEPQVCERFADTPFPVKQEEPNRPCDGSSR